MTKIMPKNRSATLSKYRNTLGEAVTAMNEERDRIRDSYKDSKDYLRAGRDNGSLTDREYSQMLKKLKADLKDQMDNLFAKIKENRRLMDRLIETTHEEEAATSEHKQRRTRRKQPT